MRIFRAYQFIIKITQSIRSLRSQVEHAYVSHTRDIENYRNCISDFQPSCKIGKITHPNDRIPPPDEPEEAATKAPARS